MTNKDDEIQQGDPRAATVMAIHLVRQVLDEAYIIANAAHDSGEPWQYVSGLTKLRRCTIDETNEEDKAFPMLAVNIYTDSKLYKTPSKVVTSTPQKAAGISVSPNDHTLIGQGDEEFIGDTDESKSTSMFITHLFDMSDVERDMSFNEPVLEQNEPNNLIMISMKKIMDSFVDSAMNSAFGNETLETDLKESSDTITSSYSFLDDATNEEILPNTSRHDETYSKMPNVDATINKQDFARYEKAFLSLNRDFEQYSDDDEEPVLQDPKGLNLQEIELMTRDSSKDISPVKEVKKKEFAAVSGVSSSALGSKKSSIVRRCKTQGARLMACLRSWWWRRKIPGKRREFRVADSRRGVCPLSPEARRRAASLLDERQLRSPTPTRSVIWKFNTINEALVHSAQWKEFTSDMKSNDD
ncbi:uncharacterized protein LOC123714084 [Pieris brassicae]|uniref:Uncharacterized protein n=1 Tax=Pieris brassicae TaxID=7116 RepID=A0A9P0SX40_PIEBR|nr:uncharacterized protein LOC123714084 [Pieris brassicae]CAH3982228.1 unnamed protein product [Pieris brassicae]